MGVLVVLGIELSLVSSLLQGSLWSVYIRTGLVILNHHLVMCSELWRDLLQVFGNVSLWLGQSRDRLLSSVVRVGELSLWVENWVLS